METGMLQIEVELINEKAKFKSAVRENAAIIMDYIPPIGDGDGYMPLELFLMSFASCSGVSVASLLRKMRKTITGLKISATGKRRDLHPTGFERIKLGFEVKSRDIERVDLEKVISMAEEEYCPIWAMIRNNVVVEWEIEIIRD